MSDLDGKGANNDSQRNRQFIRQWRRLYLQVEWCHDLTQNVWKASAADRVFRLWLGRLFVGVGYAR